MPTCVCLRLVCCDRGGSEVEGPRLFLYSDGDGRSLAEIEVFADTFLELATERFDSRVAASGLPVEANWTFDHLQVTHIYTGAEISGAAY